MFVNATPTERLPWHFQRLLQATVSISNMYISEFRYRWPKVCSILWPLHYTSMGEKWKAPLLDKNHSKHYQTSGYRYNWHHESDRWPLVMLPRSFQVNQFQQQFSSITFDRDRLERLKHHRCVQTDDADRLMCNMTFTWGQIFNMTF